MTDTEPQELDDVAARALASIILERTADALGEGADAAAAALVALERDAGLPLDVCAAILYVTSWFAGTATIEAQAVYAASLSMQPDDDETNG